MPTPNPNSKTYGFNDLFVTTLSLPETSKGIADGISKSVGLLDKLEKANQSRGVSGGTDLPFPINYDTLKTFQFYFDNETLNTTSNEVFSGFVYDWKQAACSVVNTGYEEMVNGAGDTQQFDIIEERIKVLERTMRNNIGGDVGGVYSSGLAFGGKSIGGIPQLISATPAVGTVGGINRATVGNEFARNKAFRALTDGGAVKSAANFRSYLNKAYIACSRTGEKPNLFVADDLDFNMYEDALSPMQQTQNSQSANAGWQELTYKGSPFIYDGGFGGACPAATTYGINLNHVFWRYHKKRNMTMLKPRESVNQDASINYMVWMGNLCMDLPFLNFVLTNT